MYLPGKFQTRVEENRKMKPFEKEMWNSYKKAAMSYSHDITGLYIELENIAAKYLKSGEMSAGERFSVPLSSGQILSMAFYKGRTEIYWQSVNGGDIETLVSEKESRTIGITKEYTALRTLGQSLKLNGEAIGMPTPDSFREMIFSFKPGEIISFEEIGAYVCEYNRDGKEISLKPVYKGNIEEIDIDRFVPSKSVEMKIYDNKKIAEFYLKNKKPLTESVEISTYRLDHAIKQVDMLESRAKRGVNVIQIGPVKLTLDKKIFGNNTWRNEKGKIIPRDSVNFLVGYLNTIPKETKIINKPDADLPLVSNSILIRKIESLAKTGDFMGVYEQIKDSVTKNGGVAAIKIQQYSLDNEINDLSFKARSFQILSENGECKIYLCSHKDNNVSSEIDGMEEISPQEFVGYYKKIYDAKRDSILSEEYSKIQSFAKRIDDRVAKNIADIAENRTDNKMSSLPSLISESNISKSDFRNILLGHSETKDGYDTDKIFTGDNGDFERY